MKKIIVSGAALAGTAVILGALNAHYFKQFFSPELTASFDTGVRYQMYHALAILLLATLANYLGQQKASSIFWLFIIGVLLFSGSIYLLCAFKSNGIIGLTGLGILTPIGGLILIIGWVYLIYTVLKTKTPA